MIRWGLLNQHVRAWGDYCRIYEAQEEEATNQCADGLIVCIGILPPRKTPNLLADPPDTVGRLFQSADDGVKEPVRKLHQRVDPWLDDLLHARMRSGLLGSDAFGKMCGQRLAACFDLIHHALVDLERVDLEVQIPHLSQRVDLF